MTRYPRISIYVAQVEHCLAPRCTGQEGERSGLVQRLVDRYDEVCHRSLPVLSVTEWRLVCDALNGVIHEPAAHIAVAWAGIADSIRLEGLAEKWRVDGPALVARLQALTYAEELALVDVAERYWAAVARGEEPRVPGEAPVTPPAAPSPGLPRTPEVGRRDL